MNYIKGLVNIMNNGTVLTIEDVVNQNYKRYGKRVLIFLIIVIIVWMLTTICVYMDPEYSYLINELIKNKSLSDYLNNCGNYNLIYALPISLLFPMIFWIIPCFTFHDIYYRGSDSKPFRFYKSSMLLKAYDGSETVKVGVRHIPRLDEYRKPRYAILTDYNDNNYYLTDGF